MRTEEPFPPPSVSLCLPLWDTHSFTHTRTHTVLQWNLPGFVIRAPLTGGRKHSEERRGTLHICFGWWVPADRLLFVYVLHPYSKSASHYGRMETAVCWLAASAGRRYVPHVWGFFLLFFSWFYSTFFMEAVIAMVSHSWVAIVKSIPTTTTPLFPLLNALV